MTELTREDVLQAFGVTEDDMAELDAVMGPKAKREAFGQVIVERAAMLEAKISRRFLNG